MFWFSKLDFHPVLKLKKPKQTLKRISKIFYKVRLKKKIKNCHDSFRQIIIQQQPVSDVFKVIGFSKKILSHFEFDLVKFHSSKQFSHSPSNNFS